MSLNLMKSLRNAALAAVMLTAGVANAALYQFTLTGDYSASWQLNSTVTADDASSGVGFIIYDVDGNFPGSLIDLADLYFYNASEGGGFEIYDFYNDNYLLSTDGTQLYTGDEEGLITFLTGTFNLTEYQGTGAYTLTVTDLDAPTDPGTPGEVPEPASIAIVLGGLGLMGALRKRKLR